MTCQCCHSECKPEDRFCPRCGAEQNTVKRAQCANQMIPICILSVLAVLGTVVFFLA